MNTQPPKTTDEQLSDVLYGLAEECGVINVDISAELKQLKALLAAERLDELDKQASVTSGITDTDMCMKLLAERHLMRIQELGAYIKQLKQEDELTREEGDA